MFDRDFMEYHSDRFSDHSLLAYDEQGRLIACLPASAKDGTLYTHQGLTFGGWITDSSMRAALMLSLFDALKTHMLENGFKRLVYKVVPYVYHAQPAQEDVYALFRSGATQFRVDVSATVNLRNRIPFSELRKRGVKKAAKNNVTVQKSERVEEYMDLLAATLRERHEANPVHSTEELELLRSRFPENIKLFTAERDGKILAGTVVFEYPKLAHAQYIAASPEARDVGALDAVFSYLITDVYKDKDFFDFGISNEEGGKVLNEGLINQKEGFGARAMCHSFYELHV